MSLMGSCFPLVSLPQRGFLVTLPLKQPVKILFRNAIIWAKW